MICYSCQAKKEDKFNDSLILETKYWYVTLAENQIYLGRCVIIAQKHKESLNELTNEEIIDFLNIIKKLENSAKRAFNATMFNLTSLMNDDYKNKNPEPHIHWHFRPRYKKEVKIKGEIFKDNEFAHHYDNNKKRLISAEIREEIIKMYKDNLDLE